MPSEHDDLTEDLGLPVAVFAGRARPVAHAGAVDDPTVVRHRFGTGSEPLPRRPRAVVVDTAALIPVALLALFIVAFTMAVATR
jgi:hypothetical protein